MLSLENWGGELYTCIHAQKSKALASPIIVLVLSAVARS